MNKKVLVPFLFLAIVSLLMSFGCGGNLPAPKLHGPNEANITWSQVQQPDTGRCYQFALYKEFHANLGYGYMGMAEIPCSDMK